MPADPAHSHRAPVSPAVPSPPRIGWIPQGRGQEMALACPIREILLDGNRGGGKSETLLMKFLRHVGQYGMAWRGIIFRREYKHLDDLVVKSRRLFGRLGVKAKWLNSKSDYKWVFPGGEELLFRTIKDPEDYWSYHGHEYPFIAWDELTSWPDDACYERMRSCNRCSVPGVPRFYIATSNPFGPGHGWVRHRFVDIGPPGTIAYDSRGNPRVRIRLDLRDNRALMEADPEYIQTLEDIGNDALRRAWLDGDWNIVVGGFFQGVWDERHHVLEPFAIPDDWPRWRAIDWGFAKPYSVGWYARDPDSGVIYRYRELYGYGGKPNTGTRESPEEVARKILKLERREREAGIRFVGNPADSAMWIATGAKEQGREISPASLFLDAGVDWQPARKGGGSRVAGAHVVLQALKSHRFAVFSTCEHWLRTVPVLMPDPNNWEDVDTEQEDHCFALDTRVLTPEGLRPLRDLLGTTGRVWSAGGWQVYLSCRITRRGAHLVRVRFEDDTTVDCTPDHRFLGEDRTWKRAATLAGQRILLSSHRPSNGSTASDTIDAAGTSRETSNEMARRHGSTCTALSGWRTMGRFLKTVMFTTATMIRRTIASRISSFWSTSSISVCTPGNGALEGIPWSRGWLWHVQRSGMAPRKEDGGTVSISSGISGNCTQNGVSRSDVRSAGAPITRHEWLRDSPGTVPPDAVPVRVVAVEPLPGRHEVACLYVPATGMFCLENGAYVSNCYDETRYSLVSRHMTKRTREETPEGPAPGTFDWLVSEAWKKDA